MKFHEIYNFSHLLGTFAANANGTVLPGLNGSPTIGNQWSTSQGYMGRTEDDWYRVETGSATAQTATTKQINLSQTLGLLPGFTMTRESRLFGGMRIRSRTTDRNGRAAVQMNNLLSLYQGSNTLALLPVNAAKFAPGKDYYLEWELNGKDNKIRTWLDGELITDIALPAWVGTALGRPTETNYNLNMHIGQLPAISCTYNDNLAMEVRDGYIFEPETDAEAKRLGPQKLVKLPLTVQSSPGWTANDGGTVLNAITHPYVVAADIDTPYAKPDASFGDLDVKLNAANVGAAVTAFVVETSGKRLTGAAGSFETQLVKNGEAIATNTFTLAAAVQQGKRMFVSNKMPDGSAWNKAQIEALTLRLKPKAS